MLLQLLNFNTPRREFTVGNEALCVPGKLVDQAFRQMFSGIDFMHLLIGRKALNPFMMTSAPSD